MSTGIEQLGNLLRSQMKNVSEYMSGDATVQLGKITSGLGLKLDNYSYTIPKKDYMVCRSAYYSSTQFNTASAGTEEPHTHSVNLPSCFHPIKSGDRVLVVIVGTEPVVVDVVKRA